MYLQKCGILAALLLVLICFTHTSQGAKKKKRVIVKVPARIKHIYHHHTKNLHIHKPKPKPEPFKSYDAPPRRPQPYSGGKKRIPPWKEYDEDYGYDDDYEYGGNYPNYNDWNDDKGRYKESRGRYRDEKRGGGYNYDVPKGGKWREGGTRGKGYSGYSKRSPQYKNTKSSKKYNRKPYRDVYEGAGTAPWPEVKEHDSWHQPRPQGFQQNGRYIPPDQYHDTSIHSLDYTDKQPSNFHPSVVPFERPGYNRANTFESPILEQQSSASFSNPVAEPLRHPPPSDYPSQDYFQPIASSIHPVTSEGTDYNSPTGLYPVQSYDQTQSFHDSQTYQPHHLQ